MIVTFTPFGVPSEYSCRGWRPTGSSLSCVGPAIGRLMLANRPPLSLFQLQTLGGTYSDGSVIGLAPGISRTINRHQILPIGNPRGFDRAGRARTRICRVGD